MKYLLNILSLTLIFSTAAIATEKVEDPVDVTALRALYHSKVMNKDLTEFLKDQAVINKTILDTPDLDATVFDVPENHDFHVFAYNWLNAMQKDDRLTALAMELRGITKVGDAIDGPERQERLSDKMFSKKAKKMLGKGFVKAVASAATVGDQAYGWNTTVNLYHEAIKVSQEKEQLPIFVRLKMNSKGSAIKFTEYAVRLASRHIMIAKGFVDEKMSIFDQIPNPTVNNSNN